MNRKRDRFDKDFIISEDKCEKCLVLGETVPPFQSIYVVEWRENGDHKNENGNIDDLGFAGSDDFFDFERHGDAETSLESDKRVYKTCNSGNMRNKNI